MGNKRKQNHRIRELFKEGDSTSNFTSRLFLITWLGFKIHKILLQRTYGKGEKT